ncbi:17647_t:CDS:1, partial [Racocetra persica]
LFYNHKKLNSKSTSMNLPYETIVCDSDISLEYTLDKEYHSSIYTKAWHKTLHED